MDDPSHYRGGTGDGLERLWSTIRDLQRQVGELQGGAPLRSAGIGMDDDGMTIDSSLTIVGNLNLPAGIIEGDALAEQISADADSTATSGVSWTGGWADRLGASIPVPSWATTAVVIATATVYLLGSLEDTCAIRINIGGQSGPPLTTGPSRWGAQRGPMSGATSHLRVYSPGSSISVQLQADAREWADQFNPSDSEAQINALALFMR